MRPRTLLLTAVLFGASFVSRAEVVRPAPDIRLAGPQGQARSISAFRGQPVVVVVAPGPRSRAFRTQLARLRPEFERLAAQKTLFIAAFTQEPGSVPSNIPFLTAADGPATAAALGLNSAFGIAIIGRDGNLDIVTPRVLPGQRVLDIINNSFVSQERLRRL
ncbi:MAG: hypothetical protein N2322_02985 [Terrimicrobiaceae bacterium]|nr:hypothetical protein [Terrimicrobiaceae bacterium]